MPAVIVMRDVLLYARVRLLVAVDGWSNEDNAREGDEVWIDAERGGGGEGWIRGRGRVE